MCGRYALRITLPELAAALGIGAPDDLAWQPRYNIAPTEQVLVVRMDDDGELRLTTARWGLVPAWSKGPDARYSMFNARLEGIASKPAFRAPVRRRRCAVPADGWYEWRKVDDGKQPYLLHTSNHAPMLLAGVWDRWQAPDGESLDSCAILTTDASGPAREIHPRMPVVLGEAATARWLDPQMNDAAEAIASLDPSAEAALLETTKVSRYVNNARHEGPQCVESTDVD